MPMLTMIPNGVESSVEVAPQYMLADVLRDRLGLIGTKIGCGEGECGASTVIVNGQAVISCLYPALKAQKRQVATADRLAANGELHTLERALVDAGAVQCGFCTPGMLMAANALLDENPHPAEAEVKAAI